MVTAAPAGEVSVGQVYIVREDEKRFNRKRLLTVKEIRTTGETGQPIERPYAVCESSVIGLPTRIIKVALDRLICPALYRREKVLEAHP